MSALRYLKLDTVFSFWPFTLTSLWMPLAVFVLSTDLHLVPCAGFSATFNCVFLFQLCLSYSVYVLSKPQTDNISAVYSNRTVIFSQNIRHDSFEKNNERVNDRKQPCLSPTAVLIPSPVLPFIWTILVALPWRSMTQTSAW